MLELVSIFHIFPQCYSLSLLSLTDHRAGLLQRSISGAQRWSLLFFFWPFVIPSLNKSVFLSVLSVLAAERGSLAL